MNNLHKIRELSWNEVFSLWRDQEAQLPHWIAHYQKRGFSSWDEWRQNSVRALHPASLSWALYRVQNPEQTIPQFRCGPFRSWVAKYFHDRPSPTFAEVVQDPAWQESQTIAEMIERFPLETTLIGLRQKDTITIIEGLHRCCAFAIAAQKNIILKSDVQIALADYSDAIPLMGNAKSPAE